MPIHTIFRQKTLVSFSPWVERSEKKEKKTEK